MRGRTWMLLVVTALVLALPGCDLEDVFSGEIPEPVKAGVITADDGLTAARAGMYAAITTLRTDDPSSRAIAPLEAAMPYVDKAQPVVRSLREQVAAPEFDLGRTVIATTTAYSDAGLPYGQIVKGIGAGLGFVITAIGGLFIGKKKGEGAAREIAGAVERAKDATGKVDFSSAEAVKILDSMGSAAKALVDAAQNEVNKTRSVA